MSQEQKKIFKRMDSEYQKLNCHHYSKIISVGKDVSKYEESIKRPIKNTSM